MNNFSSTKVLFIISLCGISCFNILDSLIFYKYHFVYENISFLVSVIMIKFGNNIYYTISIVYANLSIGALVDDVIKFDLSR